MRRILKLTGADRILDAYPTLAAALAGQSGSPTQPPPEVISRTLDTSFLDGHGGGVKGA